MLRRRTSVHLATALSALTLLGACSSGDASTVVGAEAGTEPVATVAAPVATEPATAGAPTANAPTSDAPTTDAPTSDAPATGPAAADPASSVPPGGYVSALHDEVVDDPRFDQVEADVIDRITQAGLPGASLLVVQHGELVEQEAWLGYDLDTAVPIASGTKWLSATVLMTLVDDGTLALDEPISTYLPDAAGTRVGTITLRMLLSFTSGLVDDDRVPCHDDPDLTLLDCVAEIARQGVVHTPGTAFRYGGQHLAMAAAVAEVVTGQAWVDLLDERLLSPLGMAHTRMIQIGDPTRAVVDHPSPAGGAVSTLGDYARFLEMIVHDGVAPDGTRILSSAASAEMQRNQIEDAAYRAASPFRMQLRSPYGFGEWIDWTDEEGRALVLSSDGAFGFRPWIDRVNDLFGVYLVNDQGDGYVEGDPSATPDDGGKVHTSGGWIFEWVAEALGGSLPDVYYPDRA